MVSEAEVKALKGRIVEIVVKDHFSAEEELIVLTRCLIRVYGEVYEVKDGYVYLVTEWSWFDDEEPKPRSKWAALIDAIVSIRVLD